MKKNGTTYWPLGFEFSRSPQSLLILLNSKLIPIYLAQPIAVTHINLNIMLSFHPVYIVNFFYRVYPSFVCVDEYAPIDCHILNACHHCVLAIYTYKYYPTILMSTLEVAEIQKKICERKLNFVVVVHLKFST